jgi:hypothetical protein
MTTDYESEGSVATLTDPIPVLLTPDQRSRVAKIAKDEGISMALVMREILDRGLPARERLSMTRQGMLPSS